MYIANEALLRKEYENNAAQRAAKAYEEQCKQTEFGFLNAYDILRVFAANDEGRVTNVGARARQIVAEQDLPLMELGVGRWIVTHTVSAPEVDQ